MADTLNTILTKVSTVVSQTTSVVDTSEEYSLWKSYVNMAQREWAETYDWQSLYAEYNTKSTTNTGMATITLPSDFRKLAAYPRITGDGVTTDEYTQIDPQKAQLMGDVNYCYILSGNGNKYLIISPSTLASGVSIHVPYWRSPASLVSPADMVDCPNPDYLVQRTIAYIWEAREDNRFPQAKAEADKILARLLEGENTYGYGYDNKILTNEERNYSFRIGRD